jgi:hypothetical protein
MIENPAAPDVIAGDGKGKCIVRVFPRFKDAGEGKLVLLITINHAKKGFLGELGLAYVALMWVA